MVVVVEVVVVVVEAVVVVEVTDVVLVVVTDVVLVGVVVGVDVPVVVGEVTWHSNRLPPSCAAKAALNRIRSAGQVVTSASADAVRRSRGSQGGPGPYILVQWSQLNMNSPSFATPVSLSTVLPRSNTVSSAGNWLNSYMISMVRFATISHSASELPNVRMLPSLKVAASSLRRQSAHPIVMPTFLFSILCILDIQKRHNKKCTP